MAASSRLIGSPDELVGGLWCQLDRLNNMADIPVAKSDVTTSRSGRRMNEAAASKAAGAEPRRGNFGMKARLFLAFLAMAAMTAVASGVAWYVFIGIDRAVTRIIDDSVVGMAAPLRLAEKSAEIAATAPALIASRTDAAREREQRRLIERVHELVSVIESLSAHGVDSERIQFLTLIENEIAVELEKLDTAVSGRLRYNELREKAASDLASLHGGFLDKLTPMVDDATFDLILSSEEVTARSTEAINGLVDGGVGALHQILTINAKGNLATGLLNEAASVTDATQIGPIRERFLAAAAAIERSLRQLPASKEKDRLKKASDELLGLGIGVENLFDAREQELRALDEARVTLQARRQQMTETVKSSHDLLLDILVPIVDDAAFALVMNSEELTAENTEAISDLVEGGVSNLHRILTVNAEANLAAGLLNEAAHAEHSTMIQPIRERFLAAAAAIDRNLRQLPNTPEMQDLRRASSRLTEIGTGKENLFEARARELRAIIVARESLQAKRERMAAAVNVSHDALLQILAPMVDDAAFELVMTSEEVTSESTEAITGLVEGGVNRLRVLLSLRAKANLAAGLLNEAAGVPDPSLLQPLRERFIAATNHIERLVADIPGDIDDGSVRDLAKALVAFGRNEENIFDLRRGELLQVAAAEASLEANRVLALRLGEEVAKLVTAAQLSSDAAAEHSAKAIGNGKLLLLLITGISATGATLIVLYYVAPRIVKPLENITAAMSDLAGGDTSADIPYRDRRDEIGLMAQALGVFRDITIEVQESNLRDIQQARRRLADAIESITEGFSLYDGEDRLVICNQRYRTLLYPDMVDEIVTGMTFEEIIRSAAERGYVKDAEGRIEEWVENRLAGHREPGEPQMQQRSTGQWLLISERKMHDGGTVAVYSDITDMKQREEELAEKSAALETLSGKLAKYLSPQIYESIFSGEQEAGIASTRKKLTVFFSDIANFTETTERLESEELTLLLNHYLTEMSRIALDHGATIDKYVGDAIVIFFGDPETRGVKEDALACLKMAIAMRDRMLDLENVWRDSGIQNPLKCRIGINTGYCTVGNFGSDDRMDYTIIGGGVNLASRLESNATPGEILISYETYAHVKDSIICEEAGPINVKGIAYPVETYRAIELLPDQEAEHNAVQESLPDLKIDLRLDEMSKADRRKASDLLRRTLKKLVDFEKQAKTDPQS
jgi:class 3 adenylate cyclase/phosphoglycerate-specific signal transduction histidine kinase